MTPALGGSLRPRVNYPTAGKSEFIGRAARMGGPTVRFQMLWRRFDRGREVGPLLLYCPTLFMPEPSEFLDGDPVLRITLEISAIPAWPGYLPVYIKTKT